MSDLEKINSIFEKWMHVTEARTGKSCLQVGNPKGKLLLHSLRRRSYPKGCSVNTMQAF